MGAGIVYIAVLLTTGYVWTRLHYPSRYKQNRASGWNFYFTNLAWGVLFFAVTLPIYLFFDTNGIDGKLLSLLDLSKSDTKQWPLSTHEIKLFVWCAMALLVAALFGTWSSIYFSTPPYKEKANQRLTRNHPIESIIYESVKRYNSGEGFLAFNLKSRKVYVGTCDEISLEDGELIGITITPALSGYREKETLKLVFTVNYFDHYTSIPEENHETPEAVVAKFKTVLLLSEIESISYFNPDTYAKFQESRDPTPASIISTYSFQLPTPPIQDG